MTEEEIRNAINRFKFYARPSNSGSNSSPVTVSDIKTLIDETAKLFETLAHSKD